MKLVTLLVLLLSVLVVGTQARRAKSRNGAINNRSPSEFRGVSLVARLDEAGQVLEQRETTENTVNALDHVNGPRDDTQPKRSRPKQKGKKHHHRKEKLAEAEDAERRVRDGSWFYCDNNQVPRAVEDVMDEGRDRGLMCSREYPTHTCCAENDLTIELISSRIVEQISDLHCARMMMKLRCAHCSPRSWWLFHAPDRVRDAHPRSMPILCPKFCRKFHDACRNSVAGLNNDNYCDYHTTRADGPCFPDYEIRRGTID